LAVDGARGAAGYVGDFIFGIEGDVVQASKKDETTQDASAPVRSVSMKKHMQ